MQADQHLKIGFKGSRRGADGKRARVAAGLAAGLLILAGGADAEVALPRLDGNQHVGVVTCAGSTCHGALVPREASSVLQNEFFTWRRRGRHSRTLDVLGGERAGRIADRLGLGPPQQADACLDCHADNVAPESRGPRFRLADGVGCEACHGGAGQWLRSHSDPDTSHADNVAAGLYPTEEPAARTRLCMSCHYSHPETPMTHELMSAGHPPLLFDLDVFTHLQPPHHRVDDDYQARKGAVASAAAWAVGEAESAVVMLEALAARLDDRQGLFPDFYLFDCNSCHHDLRGDWSGRPVEGLGPGELRLEDASLRMVGYIAGATDRELGQAWSRQLAELHAATGQDGATAGAAAGRLRELARGTRERLEERPIDAELGSAIMRRIVDAGIRSGFRDHRWAEQSAMALGSLLAAAAEQGWFGGARQGRLDRALDGLYAVLAQGSYVPARYRDSLRAFEDALG